MSPNQSTALILFAHGARDPEWATPLHRIRELVAARRPALRVELAFLEIMQPTLGEAVAELARAGHTRILIAPLFLAPGGHLKRDVPLLIEEARGRYPGVAFELLPALGEIDAVIEAAAAWLAARTTEQD
ncbi:MAG: CbiX/SirB N-terminal domain-containing protein [Betaproteobacteria bacterium]|nr:CbiX/SirB N-terminal domain-containing protein [Betaproteobacteria bacterium]